MVIAKILGFFYECALVLSTYEVFTTLTTSYTKLYITKLSAPSKQFVFYVNKVYSNGVYIFKRGRLGANPEEVLKYFGFEGKLNVEIDDVNKIIILELNQ